MLSGMFLAYEIIFILDTYENIVYNNYKGYENIV